jgi:type II secretory pathway pseudopilin PulG
MNKKGVSLIFVILVLVVMSILSIAIFTLFTSNIAQAKYQQDSVKAHYVAISGVDVSFAALLQENKSLLLNYFNKAIDVTVTPISDTITLTNGHADIIISSYIDNSERWVLITSTGVVNNSTATRTIKMNFRVQYPEVQIWE